MQKYFLGTIKQTKYNINNLLQRNFSTLIIPEISNGKINSSVLNLTKAASQLDKDVMKFLIIFILRFKF